MKSRTIAVLGGPESGKSTYLGAVVSALEDGQTPGLALDRLSEDIRAWEQLSEPLLEGAYPQRTKAERHQLELPLELVPLPQGAAGTSLVNEPTPLALHMGDYDGEEVERLFRDRTRGWSDEWRTRAMADGLLLLLRPPALRPIRQQPMRPAPSEAEQWQWLAGRARPDDDTTALSAAASTPGPQNYFGPGLVDEEVPTPPPAQPDDPVVIPTVLAIIELLQFIRHVRDLAPGERPRHGSFRIALLVAAWDAVDQDWHSRGAAAYLGEHLPLLEDFLWSNFHEADVFRFGLSSTGGDLNDPAYRERYGKHPGGFVTWTNARGQQVRSRNLATPLQWALFGDRALLPDTPE